MGNLQPGTLAQIDCRHGNMKIFKGVKTNETRGY
jgi:hypothetical protein